jgi:flavin reductase (DIM6/NTAB) family NADH-FMN oxidoreductase RutF
MVNSFQDMSFADRSALLSLLIAPRPLAWITSRGPQPGCADNIAPFNALSALANDPPLLGVAFSERDGAPKDTLANMEATREFVLNVVTADLADRMNESARECGRDVDDFARLGLTRAPIDGVSVPRVLESPAALACHLEELLSLPSSRVRLAVARVVGVYVPTGYDPVQAGVLSSVGPLRYATLRDPFILPKTWG